MPLSAVDAEDSDLDSEQMSKGDKLFGCHAYTDGPAKSTSTFAEGGDWNGMVTESQSGFRDDISFDGLEDTNSCSSLGSVNTIEQYGEQQKKSDSPNSIVDDSIHPEFIESNRATHTESTSGPIDDGTLGWIDSPDEQTVGDAWSLDDYDGLEEDEFVDSREHSLRPDTRITREYRASQQAAELAFTLNLDERMQDLIEDAFYDWGWNATKRALRSVISKGLTADELEIGISLRRLWESDESLWASVGKYDVRALSWGNAVAVGKAFNAYPDMDEIEHWLHHVLDRWSSSSALRREYLTFHTFLSVAVSSPFNDQMVCPSVSIVDGCFHEQYDDDFSCGSYSGAPPVMMEYENLRLRRVRIW